jgi:pre-mRNA-splicing factor 38A
MSATNFATLIDLVTKDKIVRSLYWTTKAARLEILPLVELVVDLQYIGGVFGEYRTPTPYMCLMYRMLQLAPAPELVATMWQQDVHKYLRVFALHYLRLVAGKKDQVAIDDLPLFIDDVMGLDYRKLRVRDSAGAFVITHVDEVCDMLLDANRDFYGTTLPTLRKPTG